MAEMLARKDMTVLGKRIPAGRPVPMDKLDRETRRKLIDQKRVAPARVEIQGTQSGGD